MAASCVRWADCDDAARAAAAAALAGLIEEEGLLGLVHVREDREHHIARGRGAPFRVERSVSLAGAVPPPLAGRLEALRRRAAALVADITADDVRLELALGTKADDPIGLINHAGQDERLFSKDFKGALALVLFHTVVGGASLDALFQLDRLRARLARSQRVTATAISLDPSLTDARRVASSFFRDIRHLWGGPDAWEAPAARAFHVRQAPTLVLVDRLRIVRWQGHPGLAAADLERAIEAMGADDAAAPETDAAAAPRSQAPEPALRDPELRAVIAAVAEALERCAAGLDLEVIVEQALEHRPGAEHHIAAVDAVITGPSVLPEHREALDQLRHELALAIGAPGNPERVRLDRRPAQGGAATKPARPHPASAGRVSPATRTPGAAPR